MRIGQWERQLLNSLDTNDKFWVRDILPEIYTDSQYVAIMRAARLLRKRGLLTLKKLDRHGDGRRFVLATRGVS